MAIFRREPDPAPAPSQPSPSRESSSAVAPRRGGTTLVAAGTRLTGTVGGATDVLVEGEVDGKVQVDARVTVAAEGKVTGEIAARSVQVGGKVQGNVRAVERIEITASGALEGDVAAPRVIIAEGAFFKGKVEMTGTDGKAETEPAKAAAARPAREAR